jgi:glycosyltransferase involved in cell wall biosynthesis
MKIAMFLDTPFPPDSRVENEAVSLIQAGHELHLFSLNYFRPDLPDQETLNGIHVHRYQAGKVIFKFSALAYTVPFFHQLIRSKIAHYIRNVQPDVLHVHDMVIAQAVFEVNKKFNLPVVLDLHENRPEIMAYYRHVNTFQGKLLINLDKWRKKQVELIDQADKVILVTEEAIDEALRHSKHQRDHFISVPNTILPSIFYQYPIKQEIIERFKGSFNILYLGDTGLRRGTLNNIKAVALLKDKIPNLKLIFVGKNKEDVVLKKAVEELGLSEHVVFEGWQNVSLFPSYILASDICLSSLSRNLHHDTTYANKIFQYMAMGRPLVVSDCPAQVHVVERHQTGLVHKAEDVQDLAGKIMQLYQDEELRKRLGDNGKKAVLETFNWNETSKHLINLYKELSETYQK